VASFSLVASAADSSVADSFVVDGAALLCDLLKNHQGYPAFCRANATVRSLALSWMMSPDSSRACR
jgi:hypothetical protein